MASIVIVVTGFTLIYIMIKISEKKLDEECKRFEELGKSISEDDNTTSKE